jgi:predicted permease
MHKLLNLVRRRRDRLESDLDRELRYHLDRRVEELVAQGVDETEARRRANLELGGLTQVQEAVRDTWTWAWLDALALDLRYAVRGLTRSPGFALGASAVLALAVAANVTIFSLVNSVLLRPLPYPDAERIVSIETLWTDTGRSSPDVSGPDFLDWQRRSDAFEAIAASYGNTDDVVVVGDRAVFANDRYVTLGFFAVFGQAASAGRLLAEQDVPQGDAEPTVAVVAHDWATRHFGSAAAAVGRTISVYGRPLEIVGVAAPGFRYPGATDLWAPWPTTGLSPDRNEHEYHAVGKLKPGIELPTARAQLRAIGDALARQHPGSRHKTASLVPLHERLTGNVAATLWVLMGAVSVVWLIGCANVANLQLARAAGRTREIALRAALGAGQGRVVRQLLTESAVLAAVAGLAGLLLSGVLIKGVVALSPADVPRLDEVRMDQGVLWFGLALALFSTVVFGLVPAVQAARLDVAGALKQAGGRATGAGGGTRLRSALVVAEVALSLVLLATAGLLLRSFQSLQLVDLGFTTDRVLVAYTEYAVSDTAGIRARTRFYADVLDRLRAVPGVSAASGVAYLGMGREPRSARDYFVQGRPEGQPGERPQAELHAITADHFRTLEIPLLAGRDFDRTDAPERPRVAIVNEALARAAFGGQPAVGQFIRMSTRAPWMEIVGVAADTRWQDPSQPPPPVVFVPSTQDWGNALSILARTSLDEESLAGTLRTLLHEADPTVPVRFDSMQALFESALAHPRLRTQVIALFAGVAALLAAVGLFSVLAYLVGRRTRELAVRRALGASTGDIVRLTAGEGMRLVAGGLALGLATALAVSRLLTGFLYEITPWDASAYIGAIAILGSASALAILVPALRATSIAPVTVLQQE